jgi:hypothetical protein
MSATYSEGDVVQVKIDKEIVQAVYRGWHTEYNMAIVEYKGQRRYRKIYEGGSTGRSAQAVPMKPSKFSITQRFEFISELVRMVIGGTSKSVIITGSGGLGKTHTVMHELKEAGFQNTDEEQDFEMVKGFATAKSLYRLLYNNKDRLVIFDDCDSVWDNPTAVSLLKAALDSYETRTLSWLSEIRGDEDDLPQQFEFTGQIIFVSNLRLSELDQAVLSRCLYVDVSMTPAEKIQRIESIIKDVLPEMSMVWKKESLDLLKEFADTIGDLNIRTFLKVCEIRNRDSANWRDVAEYVITAL